LVFLTRSLLPAHRQTSTSGYATCAYCDYASDNRTPTFPSEMHHRIRTSGGRVAAPAIAFSILEIMSLS
jgi:hypothetical protein